MCIPVQPSSKPGVTGSPEGSSAHSFGGFTPGRSRGAQQGPHPADSLEQSSWKARRELLDLYPRNSCFPPVLTVAEEEERGDRLFIGLTITSQHSSEEIKNLDFLPRAAHIEPQEPQAPVSNQQQKENHWISPLEFPLTPPLAQALSSCNSAANTSPALWQLCPPSHQHLSTWIPPS